MKQFLVLALAFLYFVDIVIGCSCEGVSGINSFFGNMNNSLLLPKKGWMIQNQYDFKKYAVNKKSVTNNESPHNIQTHTLTKIQTSLFNISYGLSNTITLNISQSVYQGQMNRSNIFGIGDMLIGGSFKLPDINGMKGVFQSGVKIPLGVSKSLYTLGNVNMNSKSYDPFISLLFVKSIKKGTVGINSYYRLTTTDKNKLNTGNISVTTLSYEYNLKYKKSCSLDTVYNNTDNMFSTSFNVFSSISFENYKRQMNGNAFMENTGGYSFFSTVGIRIHVKSWVIPVSVSLPVSERFYGNQSKTQIKFNLSLTKFL